MVFNEQTIIETVRTRLGDVDASRQTRIIWAIPQAIDRLARKVAKDPKRRHLLLTPRETTACDFIDGELDLAAKQLDATLPQLITEYLEMGSIWYSPIYSIDFIGDAIARSRPASGYLRFLEGTVAATGSLRITQGAVARGTLVFDTVPLEGETLNINGLTFTFQETPAIGEDLEAPMYLHTVFFTNNLVANASALATAIKALAGQSGFPQLANITASARKETVYLAFTLFGEAGNSFELNDSSDTSVEASADTLLGGANGIVHGETHRVNGKPIYWQDIDPQSDDTDDDEHDEFTAIRIQLDNSAEINARALAHYLNASDSPLLTVATYDVTYEIVNGIEQWYTTITYNDLGGIGNSYEIEDSSEGAITASGTTLTGGAGGIMELETVNVNGIVFTFSNFKAGVDIIPFTTNALTNARRLAAALEAHIHIALTVASYAAYDPSIEGAGGDGNTEIPAPLTGPYIRITYNTNGTAGNSFLLHDSNEGAIVASGTTLTGGLGAEEDRIYLPGHQFQQFDLVHWRTDGGPFPEMDPGPLDGTTDLYVIVQSDTEISLAFSPDEFDLASFTSPESDDATVHTLYGPEGELDPYPLQVIPNRDFADADQLFGAEYRYYWLDNQLMRVKGLTTEESPIEGYLHFSCPFVPTMADFAAEDASYKLLELHDELISSVIEVVTGPGQMEDDA